MKPRLSLSSIAALSLLISSCAVQPKYTYQDHVDNTKIKTGETVKTRVSASIEEWRNSGVLVEKSGLRGNNYRFFNKPRLNCCCWRR